MNEDPAVCLPLHETGEACDPAVAGQCRSGVCRIHAGRYMCDAAVPEDAAFCDGDGVIAPDAPLDPNEPEQQEQ